jgi:hypothetical protein
MSNAMLQHGPYHAILIDDNFDRSLAYLRLKKFGLG